LTSASNCRNFVSSDVGKTYFLRKKEKERKKESRNKTKNKNKRNENDLRLDQRPNAAKNVTDERTNELGSKVKSQNCKINPNRL